MAETASEQKTNQVWARSINGWRQVDDPTDSLWFEGASYTEEEKVRALKKLGWEVVHQTRFDAESDCAVHWYKRIDRADDRHLFDVSTHVEFETVLAEDLPSALELWKDLQLSFGAIGEQLYRLDDKLKKLFRLHHGHESYDACPECDPVAFDLEQQRRKERKQNVAKA
jgi:hypothetical protein